MRSLFLWILVLGLFGCSSDGEEENTESTQAISAQMVYEAGCQSCHGTDGQGTGSGVSLQNCATCDDRTALVNIIATTMPKPYKAETACDGECAEKMADYIMSAFNGSSATEQPLITSLNENGQTLYQAQCVDCHGADGQGTEFGTPLVSCAFCNDFNALRDKIATSMPLPYSEQNACDGECAQDVAEYILYAFNGSALLDASKNLKDLGLMDRKSSFRKASLELAGALPSQQQLAFFEQDNPISDQDYSDLLDDILSSEGFLNRISEVFNDLLLSDKYLHANLRDGATNLLSNEDFETRTWWNTDEPMEGCHRALANDSLTKKPLELVRFTVKHDLPISNIVTAQYTMVNWYSQQVYGATLVDPNTLEPVDYQFRQVADNAELRQFLATTGHRWDCNNMSEQALQPDPLDFHPAIISVPSISGKRSFAGQLPHAGVLTSQMYLARYPSTATNRNRHRSYITYLKFLDTDILKITGERPGEESSASSADPTLADPNCSGCHAVLDPMASVFQNWSDQNGRYFPSDDAMHINLQRLRRENSWSSAGIRPSGFAGETLPIVSNQRNQLQWLGQNISQDPRFIRAMVKLLYKGIIGQDVLLAPGDNASEDEITAYQAQRKVLGEIGQQLADANYNIKAAVKSLLQSPYWLANEATEDSTFSAQMIGSSKLLSPEALQRKLFAIFHETWSDLNSLNNVIMFGGMDSDSVTTRATSPSGVMVAIQERMAVEMSCQHVARDFLRTRSPELNERKLFPYVEPSYVPFDEAGFDIDSYQAAIRDNIKYLHWTLLGEVLQDNDPELERTYQLFIAVWRKGNEMLQNRDSFEPRPNNNMHWACDGDYWPWDMPHLESDSNYTVRAWKAVVTYLLSDYKFIYE